MQVGCCALCIVTVRRVSFVARQALHVVRYVLCVEHALSLHCVAMRDFLSCWQVFFPKLRILSSRMDGPWA